MLLRGECLMVVCRRTSWPRRVVRVVTFLPPLLIVRVLVTRLVVTFLCPAMATFGAKKKQNNAVIQIKGAVIFLFMRNLLVGVLMRWFVCPRLLRRVVSEVFLKLRGIF